ncbi:sensor histidine kinase [Pseudoruegeria sp. SHC-113]|uniref:sensor histidine kinase n=1 Tax=Pseudoruegeria sp. SHC-113 TaxID=2855439 RepID=UPI0021BB6F90|nr:sensor histidine kinase [Pseudoruegeria sp. SHC-113]MCT8160691.1 sensor histidine kinase [Pseudoruegeria sp. SHC-113]
MSRPAARPAVYSLRLRLFLVILTPLLLLSVILGIWRTTAAEAIAEETFDRGLLAAALAISRDVAHSEGDALSPRTRALISDAGGGEVFYHVTGPGGIYVTGYAYPPNAESTRDPAAIHYSFAQYRDEPVRVLRMVEPTVIGNLTGDTIVTVWQRVSDRAAFANALALRAAGIIGLLLLALALVVWFGVKLGLRPLNDLQAAIALRSPNELGDIQRAVPEEVAGIVATLNRLLGQVRDNIATHQAFISDAAHQLRNPAAAILSQAETLPGVQDAAARRQREEALIKAARKSARLTEQMLSLERLRYKQEDLPATAFDLNTAVRTACEDIGPLALSQGLDFALAAFPEPLPVEGDAVLIGEAVGNLIHNAMEHGGPALSAITVRTLRKGRRAEVSVADDGAGLTPEQAELAFRRFGQIASSSGSGLGLSIVEQIAQRHGGSIRIDAVPKGARLTLSLPLRS